MKKITLLVVLAMLGFGATAQEAPNKEITVGIESNSGLLVYKYGLNDKFTKRLSLKGYSRQNTSNIDLSSNINRGSGEIRSGKNTSWSFNLGYGMQQHRNLDSNLSVYIGADIFIGADKYYQYSYQEVTDTAIYNNYYNRTPYEKRLLGDFTEVEYYISHIKMSAMPFIGVNYRFTKNFKIGIEHRINLLNLDYTLGGHSSYHTKTMGYERSNYHEENKEIDYNTNFEGRTIITATYCFSSKKKNKA